MVAPRKPAWLLLLLLVPCLLTVPTARADHAAKPASQVFFVAAVDVPVTVSLDGTEVGEVDAKSVLGPIDAPTGPYSVEFRAADWSATGRVTVDGPSTDVVVHRPADASDDPLVTVFTNEVAPIRADRARLTIAHTAVVPPADVRVDGEVLFENIANGEFVTAEVPADSYSVDIVPTGGSSPLFGPVDLALEAGALNRVFAVGRPQDGSMDAVVQVIPLARTGSGPPTSVDAGQAGPVARDDTGPPAYPFLALALLAAVILTLRRPGLSRSRHGER